MRQEDYLGANYQQDEFDEVTKVSESISISSQRSSCASPTTDSLTQIEDIHNSSENESGVGNEFEVEDTDEDENIDEDFNEITPKSDDDEAESIHTNTSDETIRSELESSIKDVSVLDILPYTYTPSRTASNAGFTTSSGNGDGYSRCTLSPSIDLPSSPEATARASAENDNNNKTITPRTPLFAPIHISSKPWGTPINVDRLIIDPPSPSPVKRKFDEISRDCTGRELFTAKMLKNNAVRTSDAIKEIPNSQDEGEEISIGSYDDEDNNGDCEDESSESGSEIVPIMLDVKSLGK